MIKSDKPLLNVLNGQPTDYVPLWLMRQAGRYLPEYRQLRAKAKNFLDLCFTPQLASEITLQPIRRFHFDAAIIFADILLIPFALGQRLEFREGEGPLLDAINSENELSRLTFNIDRLSSVFETIGLVKEKLDTQTALIGFCGAPWTVACYMIDGTSKNSFAKTQVWAKEKPQWLEKLISILITVSEKYLLRQIEAGAEIIQIFDSWAGLLQNDMFERWVINPTKEIITRIKQKHPHVPIIGFPREARAMYAAYATHTGVDAMSIDQQVLLTEAQQLQKIKLLQGNLDPRLLVKGGDEMHQAVTAILTKLGSKHVFNLGHGILPETPLTHVEELIKIVRNRNKI